MDIETKNKITFSDRADGFETGLAVGVILDAIVHPMTFMCSGIISEILKIDHAISVLLMAAILPVAISSFGFIIGYDNLKEYL